MSGDWADEKAREWLAWTDSGLRDIRDAPSLAALLREVATGKLSATASNMLRDDLLARVRRVVEEESRLSSYRLVDRILARLEKL